MSADTGATGEGTRDIVTVHRRVNEHGTMTVDVHGSNEYRQVVAFAADLRAVFGDLPEGTTVPVEMERLHTRGNCWRVTSVGPAGRGEARQSAAGTARRVVDAAPSPSTR